MRLGKRHLRRINRVMFGQRPPAPFRADMALNNRVGPMIPGARGRRGLAQRIKARVRGIVTALVLTGAVAFFAPPALAGAYTYEGVATCAGSTCHGRSEGDGKVVRQDELAHWQDPASQGGAHSRAWAALASPRGARIAASLGLGLATSAPACLGCHSTNAPEALRGPRYQQSDGVGCETCHGAASGWLASHYAVGSTHASNIENGLRPLERPAVRAALCLNCHLGSEATGHFVTHRMMAAGHPRISFELDLFTAIQQHHNESASYAARKGRVDHVRLWAVGQAEAVERIVKLYSSPGLASQGAFPEFYFFDCHSCHRQIDDNPARARQFATNPERPIPFGTPPFNDESIITLSAVARVLAPSEAADFDANARAFHASMGRSRADVLAAGARLSASAARLERALDTGTGRDTAFSVIAAIGQQATANRFTDYEGSVQAVMAVDTLLNALVHDGRVSIGAAAAIRVHINRAYDAVKTPNGFNPAAFRLALGDATHAIGVLR